MSTMQRVLLKCAPNMTHVSCALSLCRLPRQPGWDPEFVQWYSGLLCLRTRPSLPSRRQVGGSSPPLVLLVPPGRPWGRGWWPIELRNCRLLAAACPGQGQRHPCDLASCLPGRADPPLVWLLDCCRHAGFAASLSALPSAGLSCLDAPAPAFSDVLADRAAAFLRCSPAGFPRTPSLRGVPEDSKDVADIRHGPVKKRAPAPGKARRLLAYARRQ